MSTRPLSALYSSSFMLVHAASTYLSTPDGLVWYTPFVGLENRKVGYTSKALYNGKVVGEPWSRSGENSAFYGSFSL